jgi:hypothetical protein
MAFATAQEVRDQSSFGEVAALTDPQIDLYIERANSYMRRFVGYDYRGATDPDTVADLRRATVLLVEYIWFIDNPTVKESNMAGLDSERIGTYSYNAGAKRSEPTGNEELDQILNHLRVEPGWNLFSINGPSRVSAKPYNPHAYISGYWRDED